MDAQVPTLKTLEKYGLTEASWRALLERQGGVCAICRKLPETGRLNVDHEHVRGWKKMPPERRVQYVRGLLCYWCNKSYVGRAITIDKAKNVVAYLVAHDLRMKAMAMASIGRKSGMSRGAASLNV